MAKKQKSFADKASGKSAEKDAIMVKYVKSIKSEKTGYWRFNEQMVKLRDGENLDSALKKLDEASNLVDIDLSIFDSQEEIQDSSANKNVDESSKLSGHSKSDDESKSKDDTALNSIEEEE